MKKDHRPTLSEALRVAAQVYPENMCSTALATAAMGKAAVVIENYIDAAERLGRALEFLDHCRETSNATELGALKDAYDYVETTARRAVEVIKEGDRINA